VTTNQVKNFAASLARRYPLPIYFMEELLSSFEAEEKMRSLGVNAKKIKKHVDQEAAVLILESFLTAPRKNLYRPEQDFSKNK
ncbi:MAG: Holliday junction resolvase RuvX, partial [Mailhella sp.]|nr:Holliday junction resolvase RuvX [Mailhella sp.]